MSDRMDTPLLAECCTHGRVNHFYRVAPYTWFCSIDGCHHFIPNEQVQ